MWFARCLGHAIAIAAVASCVGACRPRAAVDPPAAPESRVVRVIAHRGASGYRPEHTRSAYVLAIEQGADMIEPDVVATRDGVLVVRHENEISSTTDVASRPELASRRTTKVIDGETITGWFTEDFTLAELRQLRARERLPQLRPASAAFDGRDGIMTLDEVIELAVEEGARRGRAVGICPETKHPSYFQSIGLPLEPALVRSLESVGWTGAEAPVCIQSFEVENLRQLDRAIDVELVQLIWKEGGPADGSGAYAEMTTAAGLEKIATYADVVAPEKGLVIGRDTRGRLLAAPTPLIADAHRAGLRVIAYTFRAEAPFLPTDTSLADELDRYLAAGIDGLFADFPDVAVAARDRALQK